MARWIHALTDLCLGILVGVSVGASVAASVIFGVSRESGYPKQYANTLAGSMFDRLGLPMVILAALATAGCIYAALKPPVGVMPSRRLLGAWKAMAAAAVLMLAGALATQFYFAPTMKHLRENSTWVDGELVDPAEKATFGRTHGLSMAVSLAATVLAAGLVVGRRVGSPVAELKKPISRLT
jgi:hypothetical protein